MDRSPRALVPLCLAAAASLASGGERLALRHVVLDLPGPPSKVVPADLDGDGRTDLTVVVAYTEIEEIGADRVEGLLTIATVIPALFDRRELRAYLATAEGDYVLAGPPLPLSSAVLSLEAGPPGVGLVALTDEGLSRLRLVQEAGNKSLQFEPLLAAQPLLAGTGNFQPALEIVHELNGDGVLDVLFPAPEGLDVVLGTATGFGSEPADRIPWTPRERLDDNGIERRYSMPEVRSIDGDEVPDLVFAASREGFSTDGPMHVLLGSAAGRFRPLRAQAVDCHDRRTDVRLAGTSPESGPWPLNLGAFRDIDGDGRAEAVFDDELSRGDGMLKGLKDAKRPMHHYTFHRLGGDLAIVPAAYSELEAVGHAFDAEVDELPLRIEQFQDLDGDGREDLVTVTLDFSMFQVLKVLATKKIGVGLDFHVFAQGSDGSFREVPGLDLSEKLTFDLDNLKLGRFAQFAGDFDGDGRRDFVHLGRGKKVTIHAGRPGCTYPKDPDLTIALDEEPASLDLVRIEDLDGDGRADLRVTRPLPVTRVDTTAAARLDLYLSTGTEP